MSTCMCSERKKINDEYVKEVFCSFKQNTSNRYLCNPRKLSYYTKKTEGKYDPSVFEYIMNRYQDSDGLFKENLYRIVKGIEERPKCKCCGKPTKWYKDQYKEYCSVSCMQKSDEVKLKRARTNFERYGVTTNLQIEEVVEKAKYNSHTKEALKKQYDTNIKKHGHKVPFLSKDIMERATTNSHDMIRSVMREMTNINRYGGTNPFCSKEIYDKGKSTCLRKYGEENYSKTKEGKARLSNILSSKEVQDKINETKKKHKSFASSKPEEELYLYIKEKFPLVERQYRDERYPWNCDFYIPELDLFLELQGTWTHGKHPYNPESIEDQGILMEWKNRNTRYYDNAIRCWTISDVKKRNKAKENNLNFHEVWSLNDGKKLIDDLYGGNQ